LNLDKDLLSIQQARDLAKRAKEAQRVLAEFTQEKIDAIVKAMRDAALENAESLAKMAIEETKLGVYEDKVTKNRFATENVYQWIKDIKTVGFIREFPERKIYEIAEPMGTIMGITPVTNPTSTVIYKALISLKARDTIVFAPHPKAVNCSKAAADILHEAAVKAGAPEGSILCMDIITKEGSNALMRDPNIDLILATGGSAMVKAAHSSGKPAIGVGPGNVPAYIERSADIRKAVSAILASKTFDNGTVCASEQNVIVDRVISPQVREAFREMGGYFLSPEEASKVEKVIFSSKGLPSPDIVGQTAQFIASKAGISVPPDTIVLIAEPGGVGPNFPLSKEKLSPVLAYFEVEDWQEGCQLCIKVLKTGGLGHTLVIHSQNEDVIREFALKKPAFRILVNTGGTHGAIGLTTGLEPSMTLGCGAMGGGITSDNVGPMHLMNIKRLAYPTMELEFKKRAVPDGRPAEEIAHLEHSRPIETEKTLTEAEIEEIVRRFLKERGLSS